jgi:hypothetical protein
MDSITDIDVFDAFLYSGSSAEAQVFDFTPLSDHCLEVFPKIESIIANIPELSGKRNHEQVVHYIFVSVTFGFPYVLKALADYEADLETYVKLQYPVLGVFVFDDFLEVACKVPLVKASSHEGVVIDCPPIYFAGKLLVPSSETGEFELGYCKDNKYHVISGLGTDIVDSCLHVRDDRRVLRFNMYTAKLSYIDTWVLDYVRIALEMALPPRYGSIQDGCPVPICGYNGSNTSLKLQEVVYDTCLQVEPVCGEFISSVTCTKFSTYKFVSVNSGVLNSSVGNYMISINGEDFFSPVEFSTVLHAVARDNRICLEDRKKVDISYLLTDFDLTRRICREGYCAVTFKYEDDRWEAIEVWSISHINRGCVRWYSAQELSSVLYEEPFSVRMNRRIYPDVTIKINSGQFWNEPARQKVFVKDMAECEKQLINSTVDGNIIMAVNLYGFTFADYLRYSVDLIRNDIVNGRMMSVSAFEKYLSMVEEFKRLPNKRIQDKNTQDFVMWVRKNEVYMSVNYVGAAFINSYAEPAQFGKRKLIEAVKRRQVRMCFGNVFSSPFFNRHYHKLHHGHVSAHMLQWITCEQDKKHVGWDSVTTTGRFLCVVNFLLYGCPGDHSVQHCCLVKKLRGLNHFGVDDWCICDTINKV